MNLRKFHLLVSSCLFITTLNASAENWNGFYVSGQVGEAWNRTKWNFTNANFFNTLGPITLGSNFNSSDSGPIGGLSAGYNYQLYSFIFGVEGSILDTGFKRTQVSPFFPATDVYTSSIRWLPIIKGVFGYGYHDWLFSLSGGWAGTSVNLKFKDTSADILANGSEWINGWVVGLDVDFKVNPSFSLGLAYDFVKMNLNNKTLACPLCGTGIGLGTPHADGNLQTQIAMFKLNYYLC